MDSVNDKVEDSSDNILGNMTSEEFRNKLYVWFEEKGVLSELRTHLRHQMIEALKTTEIGRKVSTEQRYNQTASPKYQAINLIIAEYLLHQGYHYTLSVFTSEVPVLCSLRDMLERSKPHNALFQDTDVRDILEALGLPEECDEAMGVYSAYFSGISQDPILLHLLRRLPAALRTQNTTKKSDSKQSILKDVSCSTLDQQQSEIKKIYRDVGTQISEAPMEGRVQTTTRDDVSKSSRKSTDNSDCFVSPDELNGIITKLHESMQKAFDHELEVARKEEWKKYKNLIDRREEELKRELELENEKIRKSEMKYKNRMKKELQVEHSKLMNQHKMKQLELEREMARDLELERYKILDEYRQIVQAKIIDTPGSLHDQWTLLGNALDRVQQQSDRLIEKEDLLNKRLNEVEINFQNANVRTHLSVSTETNDLQQQCEIDENILLANERRTIEKLKMELENVKMKLEYDSLSNNLPKKQVETREVQTVNTVSQFSQTDQVYFEKETQYTDPVDIVNEGGIATNKHQNKMKETNIGDIILERRESLNSMLTNIYHENTYLKAFTTQQRSQIEELLLKQTSMSEEVAEANNQVQQLSSHLLSLEKVVNKIPRDHYRIKSAPCSINRKKVVRELLTGKMQGKRVNIDTRQTRHSSSSDIEDREGQNHRRRGVRCGSKEKVEKVKRREEYIRNNKEGNRRTEIQDEDDSPTDEVLKEARKRLKILEQETEAVDRSFQEFKLKQTENMIHSYRDKSNKQKDTSTLSAMDSLSSPHKEKRNGITNYRASMYIQPNALLETIQHLQDREHTPKLYNSPRRVHQATMNIDKNVLQNYITANKIKQNYLKYSTKINLEKNIKCTVDSFAENKFSGTTDLLLKRIQNYTSDTKKYNLPQRANLNRKKEDSDNNLENISSVEDCNYGKLIGRSSEQYKIRPTLNWRNISTGLKMSDKMNNIESNNCVNIEEIKHAKTVVNSINNENLNAKCGSNINSNYEVGSSANKTELHKINTTNVSLQNDCKLNSLRTLQSPNLDSIRRRLFVENSKPNSESILKLNQTVAECEIDEISNRCDESIKGNDTYSMLIKSDFEIQMKTNSNIKDNEDLGIFNVKPNGTITMESLKPDTTTTNVLQKYDTITTELSKNDTIMNKLTRHDAIMTELPIHDTIMNELPKHDNISTVLSKHDTKITEFPKHDTITTELPKHDTIITEFPKHDSITTELPKNDTITSELPKDDAIMTELPKHDNITSELPKHDNLKIESPKPVDTVLTEIPKNIQLEIISTKFNETQVDLSNKKFETLLSSNPEAITEPQKKHLGTESGINELYVEQFGNYKNSVTIYKNELEKNIDNGKKQDIFTNNIENSDSKNSSLIEDLVVIGEKDLNEFMSIDKQMIANERNVEIKSEDIAIVEANIESEVTNEDFKVKKQNEYKSENDIIESNLKVNPVLSEEKNFKLNQVINLEESLSIGSIDSNERSVISAPQASEDDDSFWK